MTTMHYSLNIQGDKITKYSGRQFSEQSLDELTQSEGRTRLALIDRDGVVVQKSEKHTYLRTPDDIRMLDGAAQAIDYLIEKDVIVAFVTNQPGLHKGLLNVHDLTAMTGVIDTKLTKGHISSCFFCPHAKGNKEEEADPSKSCTCRKPKPGMINAARKIYGTQRENTTIFGDFASDIEASKVAGIRAVYIATRHDEHSEMQERIAMDFPDVFAKDQYATLLDAVKAVY